MWISSGCQNNQEFLLWERWQKPRKLYIENYFNGVSVRICFVSRIKKSTFFNKGRDFSWEPNEKLLESKEHEEIPAVLMA